MKEPIKKYRAGQITATIWENEPKDEKIKYKTYSTAIEKNYLVEEDGKEVWKKTSSYGLNELPKVKLVTEQAYAFILQEAKNKD